MHMKGEYLFYKLITLKLYFIYCDIKLFHSNTNNKRGNHLFRYFK